MYVLEYACHNFMLLAIICPAGTKFTKQYWQAQPPVKFAPKQLILYFAMSLF